MSDKRGGLPDFSAPEVRIRSVRLLPDQAHPGRHAPAVSEAVDAGVRKIVGLPRARPHLLLDPAKRVNGAGGLDLAVPRLNLRRSGTPGGAVDVPSANIRAIDRRYLR